MKVKRLNLSDPNFLCEGLWRFRIFLKKFFLNPREKIDKSANFLLLLFDNFKKEITAGWATIKVKIEDGLVIE